MDFEGICTYPLDPFGQGILDKESDEQHNRRAKNLQIEMSSLYVVMMSHYL